LTLVSHTGVPSYVALVFYAFVPGYSFVEALLGRTMWFEKFFTSMFFSIAFLMGIRAVDHILTVQSSSFLVFLPSSPLEFGFVFSLTTILLAYSTWRVFRSPGQSGRSVDEPKALIGQQKV
jgi:hypothetical protein